MGLLVVVAESNHGPLLAVNSSSVGSRDPDVQAA